MSRTTWNIEQFKEAVKTSYSKAEVLRKLNLVVGGANYIQFTKYIKILGIDISHFTGQGHLKGKTHNYTPSKPLNEVLIEGSCYLNTVSLKSRLLKEGLLIHKCYDCQLTVWKDKPIPIELDHINGIRDDNRLENLRLLCPNCHALTSTYRGKNISFEMHQSLKDRKDTNNPLISIKCKQCQKDFMPSDKKHQFCGVKCAREYTKKPNLCKYCGKDFLSNTQTVYCSIKCKQSAKILHRQCLNCTIEFQTLSHKVKFCSSRCSNIFNGKSESHYKKVKNRPSKEELIKMVEESNYCAVGRKFGVSDNAIRKWLKD